MDRILTWTSDTLYATYFLNRDCSVEALRIYAGRAPDAGDLVVDILDDGVSIMSPNNVLSTVTSYVPTEIHYRLSTTTEFTVGERITGATSGATGNLLVDHLHDGYMTLTQFNKTAYTKTETITGLSSGATATVDSFIPELYNTEYSTDSEGTKAILPMGENSEPDAEDFIESQTVLGAGSWITLNLTPNGAHQVTIQLELSEMDEDDEVADV